MFWRNTVDGGMRQVSRHYLNLHKKNTPKVLSPEELPSSTTWKEPKGRGSCPGQGVTCELFSQQERQQRQQQWKLDTYGCDLRRGLVDTLEYPSVLLRLGVTKEGISSLLLLLLKTLHDSVSSTYVCVTSVKSGTNDRERSSRDNYYGRKTCERQEIRKT